MTMSERSRERSQKRDAPAPANHKAFIGGIPWSYDDFTLKDGALPRPISPRARASSASATSRAPGGHLVPDLGVVARPDRILTPQPAVFADYGAVEATVVMDKLTNHSRGFGFVIFASDADLSKAVEDFHDKELGGRRISVNKAVPMSHTAPGTPSDALRHGQTVPRDAGRYDRGG